MSVGAGFRVGRGLYLGIGGSTGVALLSVILLAGGMMRVFLLTITVVTAVVIIVAIHLMNKANLKRLIDRSIELDAVVVEGRYTSPKTWGVYRIDRLVSGQRGSAFRIGNHPVRQAELEREFGGADLIALFTTRIDAEETAYILNGRRKV
jgi:hypothetical protein